MFFDAGNNGNDDKNKKNTPQGPYNPTTSCKGVFYSISIETVVSVCDGPGCSDVALCETEMVLLGVNYPLTQVIRKIHLVYTSYHLV